MSDRIDTDAVLHNAMLAAGVEVAGEKIDLEGDGSAAVREKERDELDLFNVGHDVGVEARNEVLAHLALRKIAHALGGASLLISAGVETIAKSYETIAQEKEVHEGLQRDAAVGACVILLTHTLPEGFADELRGGFATRGDQPGGAIRIVDSIMAKPDRWAIKEGLVANCKDGQEYALVRHITTPAELAVALQQNPEFAARYKHDLAFKLGADSLVWAKTHGQLPALVGQIAACPVATTLEVRG